MKIIYNTIGCGLLALLTACGGKPEKPAPAPSSQQPTVELIDLKPGKVSAKLTLTGEIIPFDRANIYARTVGYVKDVRVDIGSKVKKGQILCVLEAPELSASEAESVSKSQGALSKFESSKSTYLRLLKASQTPGAISANELEIARNQMKTDSSFYEAAKSANMANKALEDYLVVRSSFNGVVTERNIFKGDYVDNSGKILLFRVEDNSSLRVQVPVPEAYNATKIEDNKASFTVSALPGKTFTASLTRKSDAVSADTRSEIWEFDFPNQNGLLKPGMFAQVTLSVARPYEGFMVPYKAVVTTQERKFVILAENGRAKWVDVKTGFTNKDKVEIAGELKEGDKVVKQANEEMKEGSALKVKQ
ncbi:MAG TPA: efflux RND transporter periplasmic adaptor subunit [Mucilaginibacter sp.]|nr:efflux RND transporter periplasmic adaptor subunit [Mucilaginibacter sp.]